MSRSDVMSDGPQPLAVDVTDPPMRNFSTYDPSRHDAFIRFIAGMLHHSFVLADSFAESAQGTMTQLEQIVLEHTKRQKGSKLKRLVPSIGQMHTPLALGEAFCAEQRDDVGPHFPPALRALLVVRLVRVELAAARARHEQRRAEPAGAVAHDTNRLGDEQ